MATPSDELALVEEAIYDQSFRTLDEQARVLEGLRARAGTLIGAATVTTAFVGGLTVSRGSEHPRLDALSWVAIGLYVAVIFLSLLIFAPSRRWVFAHHPGRAAQRVRRTRAADVALTFSTDDRVLQRKELRREWPSTDAIVGTVPRDYGGLCGRARSLALDACDMKWPIRIRKQPKTAWPEPPPPSTPDTSTGETGPPKR